ncbi:MAG: hypothetical protein ACLP5V_03750 [Candidatus Bathyarchaeia archaeon]
MAFAEILAITSGSCDRISCLADFTCIDRSVLMLDFCNQWPSWKAVIYEKTSEEDNCPDVVVDKEESVHEEDIHEEKSAHACPKGSENGKPRLSLFSHIGHSFGRCSREGVVVLFL